MVKRTLDFIVSSILVLLTLPLQALIAGIVFIKLGRPVLFWQLRAGEGDSVFELFKFRSMLPQPLGGPMLEDQARLTDFGRFLRRFRLDELPQFWLVLNGRMSFVGPRPLYPNCTSRDNEVLFNLRRSTKPGITGWAQVNGNTLLDEREKLSLDVFYVKNQSTFFDVFIIFMTVKVILYGERRNEKEIERAIAYASCFDRDR